MVATTASLTTDLWAPCLVSLRVMPLSWLIHRGRYGGSYKSYHLWGAELKNNLKRMWWRRSKDDLLPWPWMCQKVCRGFLHNYAWLFHPLISIQRCISSRYVVKICSISTRGWSTFGTMWLAWIPPLLPPLQCTKLRVMFLGLFPRLAGWLDWIKNPKSLNFFVEFVLIFLKQRERNGAERRTAVVKKHGREELWILPISVLLYMTRSKPHCFWNVCLLRRFPVNKSLFFGSIVVISYIDPNARLLLQLKQVNIRTGGSWAMIEAFDRFPCNYVKYGSWGWRPEIKRLCCLKRCFPIFWGWQFFRSNGGLHREQKEAHAVGENVTPRNQLSIS